MVSETISQTFFRKYYEEDLPRVCLTAQRAQNRRQKHVCFYVF